MEILQTCQVALNFANEEEAKKFRKAVTDLLGRRQRKSGKYLLAFPFALCTSHEPAN